MVAIFNLITAGIFIAGAIFWWLWALNTPDHLARSKRSIVVIILTLCVHLIYQSVQPSYIPKNQVQRLDVPAFEYKELEKQDRMLKTDTKGNLNSIEKMHERFMQKPVDYEYVIESARQDQK